jgi:hypothetical protein
MTSKFSATIFDGCKNAQVLSFHSVPLQQQQRPDLSRLMQLQAAGAGLPGAMSGLPPALAAAAGKTFQFSAPFFGGLRPLVPLLLLGPPLFSNYSFCFHHPVNQDDWHLLAHAMASDFSIIWQFSQREQLTRSLPARPVLKFLSFFPVFKFERAKNADFLQRYILAGRPD